MNIELCNFATFFGGGLKDNSSMEYLDSVKIGEFLSKKGFIIKSGGYYGLMEAVSKGVNLNSGYSIGFTCATFKSTIGNDYLTDTIVCDDIYQRLRYLIEGSSLYIVQKGGIGTLSEVSLLLDEMRKEKTKKPIFIFGQDWKNLSSLVSDKQLNGLIYCDNFDDFVVKYEKYTLNE